MRKIFAALLIASMSITGVNAFTVKAADEIETVDVNVLTVVGKDNLTNNYEKLNEVDVIYTHNTIFEQLEQEQVKELLDNGTDFYIANGNVDNIVETYDINVVLEEEKKNIACYLTSENSEYEVFPIFTDVLYEEDRIVSDEEYLEDKETLYDYLAYDVLQEFYKAASESSELLNLENMSYWEPSEESYWVPGTEPYWVAEEDKISAEEVYQMVHDMEKDDFLTQITEEELASLQTSTLIGTSFCHNTKLVYFYKEGSANGTGSDYEYSTSTSKTGWSKMGSLNLGVYALKARTIDTATYNNVYSVVTASGLNDKYVTSYKVKVGVSELTSNVIMDHSKTSGGSSSTSGKLATSVNSSGTIPSSGYTTYAFNPGGQTISVDSSATYSRTWTCTPSKSTKNGSWKVRPGVLLKKTNGTTAAVTGTVSVNYFQVSGGVRTYTIKDSVTCSIKFKNHTEV